MNVSVYRLQNIQYFIYIKLDDKWFDISRMDNFAHSIDVVYNESQINNKYNVSHNIILNIIQIIKY